LGGGLAPQFESKPPKKPLMTAPAGRAKENLPSYAYVILYIKYKYLCIII